MLNIDPANCLKCGACLEECPNYVIHPVNGGVNSGKAYVKYEDQCLECGHCVAICNAGAITLNEIGLNDLEKLKKIDVNADQIKNLIYSRRSVRFFKDEPIDKDFLDEMIDVATHAGTASNSQSEGFIILQNKDKIQELEEDIINVIWSAGIKYLGSDGLIKKALLKKYGEEMILALKRYHGVIRNRTADGNRKGMIFRNAPAVILLCGPSSNGMGGANSALAVRNIELYALTKGYGAMYCGFMVGAFEKKPKLFREKLGIDKSQSIFSALLVGKPKRYYEYKLPRKTRNIKII
jgi:nitroreductase/NAD-dependent dihydropyrimidine dehydrogenase PreA subunit